MRYIDENGDWTKKPIKKIKESAIDKVFSLWIRNRDQKCMNCYSTEFLQCAHYHSRVARSVRFNPYNAIALCRRCHMVLEHKKTVEHRDLMIKIFGKKIMAQVEKEYRTLKYGGYSESEKKELLNKFKL